MLIAHLADLHITGRRDDSRATLDEQIELLRWIGEDARDAGARLIVVAGDLFDATTTPVERKAAVDVIRCWAEWMPVAGVRGNHDRLLDLYPLRSLRTKHSVAMAERPVVINIAGAAVALFPWPVKATLISALPDATPLELDAALTEGLQATLRGLQTSLEAHDCPRILVAHVEPGGAVLDTGQPVSARCVVRMSEEDLLGVGADYGALGHIHKHQTLGDGRLCFSGSIRQTTFGEDAQKGYCLVDAVRGEPPVIEHRKAPGRELVTCTGDWCGSTVTPDGAGIFECNDLLFDDLPLDTRAAKNLAIRLTYHVGDSDRAAAAKAAEETKNDLLAYGAHSVKLDPRVDTVSRVRSEKISEAKTTEDRLEAWWEARDQRPDRALEILSKLQTLEGEVAP